MTTSAVVLWSYTDNAQTALDLLATPYRDQVTLRIQALGQFFDATITIPAPQITDLATALITNTDWAYDSITDRIAILTPARAGGTLLELAEDELDVDTPPKILIPDNSRQSLTDALVRSVSLMS
ncbi:hypothetical protein HUT11_35620 (plasmid) [Streptomyces seoulensis]|nr:hypothetical protein HUT11_35620 [Streptomyces seoulensis]